MKTQPTNTGISRYRMAGRSSILTSGRPWPQHRRRNRRPLIELDRIPDLVLHRQGLGLTADEIEADLFYGRD